MTNLDSILKKQDITLPTKVHIVKAIVFPVVMNGCESWTIKKAESQKIRCFQTVVLEKMLESLLDCKEIQPVHPKGNQPWIFTGTTDTEAEAPIFWPLDVNSWLTGKDPDAGKDWGQQNGATDDEMVGWCHWLSGYEFEQTPRDSEGQGSLASCKSMGSQIVRDNSTWTTAAAPWS